MADPTLIAKGSPPDSTDPARYIEVVTDDGQVFTVEPGVTRITSGHPLAKARPALFKQEGASKETKAKPKQEAVRPETKAEPKQEGASKAKPKQEGSTIKTTTKPSTGPKQGRTDGSGEATGATGTTPKPGQASK